METSRQDVHLLIIEDSEEDTLLLVREIRRGGLNPVWERVCSSSALERALVRGSWDLVISDDALPEMNGLTALAMVRGRYPDLPFFLVSGSLSEDLAGAAIDAGATDCIAKGRWPRLVPAIRRELRRMQERAAGRAREARLESERARLAAVIDSAASGLVLCDAALRVVLANPAAVELLGTSRGILLGGSALDLFEPGDRSSVEAVLSRLAGDGPGRSARLTAAGRWGLAGPPGSRSPVIVSGAVAHLDGVRHVILALQDTALRTERADSAIVGDLPPARGRGDAPAVVVQARPPG
jgi:PAS domain S-box-containing protein